MKGVAGNLGIASVQTAAADVERVIRDGGTPPPASLSALETVLGRTAQAIRRELEATEPKPEPQATGPAPAFDPGAAVAAVARLRVLIEANDGDAANAIPALEAALAGAADPPSLDALKNAIADFDFEGALTALAAVAAQSGVAQG